MVGSFSYGSNPAMLDSGALWRPCSKCHTANLLMELKQEVEEAPCAAQSSTKAERKLKRKKRSSNEVESQRMSHIAVERNRRKQMNEHLRVLRSLMPTSYIQKGDQASIVGGAIEFVKELEMYLYSLQQQQKALKESCDKPFIVSPLPNSTLEIHPPQRTRSNMDPKYVPHSSLQTHDDGGGGEVWYVSTMKDEYNVVELVEVKRTGKDIATFNVFTKKWAHEHQHRVLRIIGAVERLHFKILHLTISSVNLQQEQDTVLFVFEVQIGAGWQVQSVKEMAASLHQTLTTMMMQT